MNKWEKSHWKRVENRRNDFEKAQKLMKQHYEKNPNIEVEEAKKVVCEIKNAGGTAKISAHDISSREGCSNLIDQCVAEFGSVDILVNNAGILRDRSLLKMTDEEFDSVWNIHVKGTFWCSQYAALKMKESGGGGSIINTTSGAHFGNFGQAPGGVWIFSGDNRSPNRKRRGGTSPTFRRVERHLFLCNFLCLQKHNYPALSAPNQTTHAA